jgi:hypothetical protein
MQLFGAAPVFKFYSCFLFNAVFTKRSPAGAKRNWESLLGTLLVNNHRAAPVGTFIDLVGRFVAQRLMGPITVVFHKVFAQAP